MGARDIIGHGGGGGKGGEQPRTPVESPDTLHSISYARILDLISEGPIKGLVNGTKSIYLDGTPLANDDNTLNFAGVTVDFRPGTQDQDHISGFPGVENELGVGIELRSSTPYTRAISNTQLSAVRVRLGIPSFSKTNTENGDIGGYAVEYSIDISTDGGSFVTVIPTAFVGKTVNEYQRSHRVDLPPATTGWLLRVRRITPNADSLTIADTTRIVSVTEVIDAKFRYPMSAIMGLQVDAKQFQSVPTRAYLMDLRIIKVPTNYDPEARTYAGTWDGTFKLAWSNNPAWVYYDLLMNDRYGLGHRINAGQVDKWALYQIAQYCDVMVSDGKGGAEPRFTCNCYIQAQAEALKVLSDLASIFRGITYWAGGMAVTSADMPSDPAYVFAPGNVLEGKFTYSGTKRKTRYTVALVSWNDPADMYRAKVAYCDDREGVARYGVRQISMTAFGCTSEGQAIRAGKWALLTSRLETGTVSFGVGLDGYIPAPGKIVAIANPARAGRRMGGRIKSAAGRVVVVDKAPAAIAPGDLLSVATPTGGLQKLAISAVSGNQITVADDWPVLPHAQAMWLAEASDLKPELYRVVSIAMRAKSSDGEGAATGMQFDVTAVMHEPGKYDLIDNGVRIDPRPVSVIPPSVQPPPTNVTITSRLVMDQGMANGIMTIAWEPAAHAVEYAVEWRKDDGEWIAIARTGSLSIEVPGIYAGQYLARVRAISAISVASLPASSVLTALVGKDTPPPAVTALTTSPKVFGIDLAWNFPASNVSDTQRTEIWHSASNDRDNAIKLGDYAYPQRTHSMVGLAGGVTFYFWARLVDRTGNVGGWYPASGTGGVSGTTSTSSSEILGYLAGQIGATQLTDALLGTIADAGVEVGVIQDQLASLYTVKTSLTVDGRLYMAGLGIGVENNEGVIESQVLVAADRFAIIDPDSEELTTPFVVQDGVTYINRAFIGTAYIEEAMIEDEAVTNSKIKNLSVDSLKLQNMTVIVPAAAQVIGTRQAYVRGDTAKTLETNIASVVVTLDGSFDVASNSTAGVDVAFTTTMSVGTLDATATGTFKLYRQINGGTPVLLSSRSQSVTLTSGSLMYGPDLNCTDFMFDQPGPGVVKYSIAIEATTNSGYPFADPQGLAIATATRSAIKVLGAKK